MELNIKKFSKETLLDVTRELSRDNPEIRNMTLALAGVDSTDCVTSIDYEERCAALEGLIEFFIQERKEAIKYIKLAQEVFKEGYMHNVGKRLQEKMEKSYE